MTDKLIKLGKKHNINIEVFNNSDKQVVIDSLNDKITKFEYCDIAMYRIKAIKDLSCVILDTEYIDNPKSIIDYLSGMSDPYILKIFNEFISFS